MEEIAQTWRPVAEGTRPGWEAWTRAYSLVMAMVGAVGFSPVMVGIAIAIWWDSPGGAIYRQLRVGREGKPFVMYKFRSMRADAERETGPVWAAVGDGRITRVGRWLRRLRLDELPQLWNVIAGDMNLVGPRPERPVFVEQFRCRISGYEQRHAVRPGITGWAQVSRGYGAGVEEARDKLAYDLMYVQQRSVGFDLKILLRTAKIVVVGRGAR